MEEKAKKYIEKQNKAVQKKEEELEKKVEEKALEDEETHDNSESEISEHLKCPLCDKLFVDPVTTSCKHTFCKACLKKTAVLMYQHKQWVRYCPTCKKNLDFDKYRSGPLFQIDADM